MKTEEKKLNLLSLVGIIISAIIGAGIFNLMSDMAQTASAGATLVGWLVAGLGMGSLAFCMQNLNTKRPDLDAGIFSYAKTGFGNYMGFNSVWGYWISVILGNVAFGTLLFSAIGYFFPVFAGGQNVASIIGASIILWLMHVMIRRGLDKASFINNLVMMAKLVPLVIFLVCVIGGFKMGVFSDDFWGTLSGNFSFSEVLPQVKGTMLITVWVFIGIEGAVVFSGRAKKRSDVGKATLLGFAAVTLIYMSVTVLSFGIMSQAELKGLDRPAMAFVLERVIGKSGAIIVNIGVIISIFGAWIANTLLAEEVAFQAGKDQLFPTFFLKENKSGMPIHSLFITNLIVQLFLLSFLVTDQAYTLMASLASSTVLLPYAFVALYQIKHTLQAERTHDFTRNMVVGLIATVYMLWLAYASGVWYLLLTVMLFFPGTLLFAFVQRTYHKQLFLTYEKVIAGFLGVAFIICLIKLVR